MTRPRARTVVLVGLLSIAVIAFVIAAIVVIPIFTHESAGGSGQQVPDDIVSETTATGADGRTRTLSALTLEGGPADLAAVTEGETLVVQGTGFDAGIGIYVSVCAIPEQPGAKPHPCLGGIPEGATTGETSGALSSAWVTDDWAWRAFATHRFDDADEGSFSVELTVPPAEHEGLDCRETPCAIATRADHTAGADRVQDMLLPLEYAR